MVYYGRTKITVRFTKRLFSPRYYSQNRSAYCAGGRMYDSRLVDYTKQKDSSHCAYSRMGDSRLVGYTKQKGIAYCASNRMHDTCLVKSTCTIELASISGGTHVAPSDGFFFKRKGELR